MKKILIAALLFFSANLALAASEQNLFTGKFGINAIYNWDKGNIKSLDLKNISGWGYDIYFTFEHPVILVPNIKMQFTQIGGSSKDSVFKQIKSDFTNLTTAGKYTGLDYSHLDTTLYYRLIGDADPFNINLGLTLRYYINPLLKIDGTVLSLSSNKKDTKFMPSDSKDYKILPLIYADINFKVPTIDLYFGVEGNFMIFQKSNSLNDWKFSAKYELGFVPIIVPGFELGYRYSGITRNIQEKTANKKDLYSINSHAIYFGIYGRW